MPSYQENMYQWLKKKGYAEKYEHPGIYCIKLDETIVYIGKSKNMLKRVAQHYVGCKSQKEKKYQILAETVRKGHTVQFDVLYYARETQYWRLKEEIGTKEGYYIRKYMPALNTQIPHKDDWRKFDMHTIDAVEVLDKLLKD